jgi:HD-GYP domain-containing protein (c-di-GMP phosphodiesterase class II)
VSNPENWSSFEEQSTQEALPARRPSTVADHAEEDQTERVCDTLADFIDLKTRETWHHSRTVAEVAVRIGTCLGLEPRELIKLRLLLLSMISAKLRRRRHTKGP